MGGLGSGRWGKYRRKLTVEECLMLDIDVLSAAGLLDRERGRIEYRGQKRTSTFAYSIEVTGAPDSLYLTLLYSDGPGQPKRQSLTLLSKPQRLGGVRWYFFCRCCTRRARKLYYTGGGFLGCRRCLDLTYRSAQEHDSRMGGLRYDPKATREAIRKRSRWATEYEQRRLSRWGEGQYNVVITSI